MKSSNLACCCRKFLAAGLVASSFKVRCMRSCRPFCCGWPGLMRSISMPSLSHQTESFDRLNRELGLAKGTPLSVRMARGRPNSLNAFKHRESIDFPGSGEGFAGKEIAAGEVGDGQRIAVSPIGKHELALVVGAPQFIRLGGARERRALGPVTSSGSPLDQAMTIKHRMHRADRGRAYVRIKPGQSFPDLRGSPTRLVLLDAHDQRLDLDRELIGMAIGPARAVSEPFQACRVVACEDLVAGLAGDAELPAQPRHLLAIQ